MKLSLPGPVHPAKQRKMKASSLLRRLHSDEVGAGARLIAWGFALVNIPTALLALVAFIFLPLTFPGIVLYVNYWRSAMDKLSISNTKSLWAWTIIYNLILIAAGVLWLSIEADRMGWVLIFPALAAAAAGVALKSIEFHEEILLEKPVTEYGPEADWSSDSEQKETDRGPESE